MWLHGRERVLVALLIQNASRRHIFICGVFGSTIFLHYFIKGTIFGKKVLNIKCMSLFYLQLLFEIFLILEIILRDIVNLKTPSRKVHVIFVGF